MMRTAHAMEPHDIESLTSITQKRKDGRPHYASNVGAIKSPGHPPSRIGSLESTVGVLRAAFVDDGVFCVHPKNADKKGTS